LRSKRRLVRLVYKIVVLLTIIFGLVPTGLGSLLGANATKIYFTPLSSTTSFPPPWDTFYYAYPVLLGYNGYILDLNVLLLIDVRKGSPYGELASNGSYAYDTALFISPGTLRLLNVSLSVPRAEIEAAANGSPLWMTITTVAWFSTYFAGSIQVITPTVIRTVIPLHTILPHYK